MSGHLRPKTPDMLEQCRPACGPGASGVGPTPGRSGVHRRGASRAGSRSGRSSSTPARPITSSRARELARSASSGAPRMVSSRPPQATVYSALGPWNSRASTSAHSTPPCSAAGRGRSWPRPPSASSATKPLDAVAVHVDGSAGCSEPAPVEGMNLAASPRGARGGHESRGSVPRPQSALNSPLRRAPTGTPPAAPRSPARTQQ
jgi:hypothetical protein